MNCSEQLDNGIFLKHENSNYFFPFNHCIYESPFAHCCRLFTKKLVLLCLSLRFHLQQPSWTEKVTSDEESSP